MDMETLRLIFLGGVIGLIFLLMYRDRENVERHGILFYRRTKKGLKLIDDIAKRFPRFWKVYAWGGVVAAFISIVAISAVIGAGIFEVASTGNPSDDFGLVAPGTGDTVNSQPGVTFVPAEYWFISIAIIMIVHELSHGVIARTQDFDINSVGVLVLGVIPGAFVEPKGSGLPGNKEDGDPAGAWDQGNWISRIKVLAAGSWANYVFAVIFALMWAGASSFLATPGEIYYTSQEGFPAENAGMNQGRLLSFNGTSIDEIQNFSDTASKIRANETYSIGTTEGEFQVTAATRDGEGHIGLMFSSFTPLERWFVQLFQIVSFLNLGIGLFNMLPAKPLDGGHILDAVAERFFGEEAGRYVNIWSALVILALVSVLLFSLLA
jgi:membrane-associated protease RseP (regulator of RpoE activity)